MTTNDDMIARFSKERQDKINKAVQEEVKKYLKNESADELNQVLKYLDWRFEKIYWKFNQKGWLFSFFVVKYEKRSNSVYEKTIYMSDISV